MDQSPHIFSRFCVESTSHAHHESIQRPNRRISPPEGHRVFNYLGLFSCRSRTCCDPGGFACVFHLAPVFRRLTTFHSQKALSKIYRSTLQVFPKACKLWTLQGACLFFLQSLHQMLCQSHAAWPICRHRNIPNFPSAWRMNL